MNKALLPVLVPAALLAFGGCATLEPPVPEADANLPADWPAPPIGEQRMEGGTDALSVTGVAWNEFFSSPELREVLTLALENNRDYRVAALNVERARALYRIERADRVPSVNAGAQITETGGDPIGQMDHARVDIGITEYEFDLFGRVRQLSAAALEQYFATVEGRRSAELALLGEVATAYITLAADQELQRIAEATLESFEEEYKLTRERYRLGAVSALDLSQSRTIVERARADVARFAGQVARDRNALALLVGAPIPPELLPEAFEPGIESVAKVPEGLPSELLLRRPDVLQAEHLLLAANANIGAARAAFFPSIRLTATAGYASEELSDLFDGSGFWAVTPRINVPIFQGGRLRARRDVAVADRDIALARYEEAIQAGFREVADALALSRTLAARRMAQEALLDASAETHRLSQIRYDAGQDSYLVLLDAQRTLYSARQDLVTTQLAEQVNRVNLYRALGGGWNAESENP